MACTVNSSALISIDDLLNYMGLSPQSLLVDAFDIYVIGTGGSSAATIQVDTFNNRVQIVITAGDDAGTHNFALSTYTTLSTLKAAIEAAIDAEVTLRTHASQLTADLPDLAATNCLAVANTVTVQVRNTCRVADAINFASELVERVTGRRFKAPTTDYVEQSRVAQDGTVTLKHWPIRYVRRVAANVVECLRISNSDANATHKIVSVDKVSNVIRLETVGGSNSGTAQVAFSTSTTVSACKTAVDAASGDWSAEIPTGTTNISNLLSTWIISHPPESVVGSGYVSLHASDTTITGWTTEDYDGGIFRLDRSYANDIVWVEYSAGFASSAIPADVLGIINQVAKEFYVSAERDSSLQSERLGDYAYTVSDEQQADITERISKQLSHHVVPI